MTIFVMKEDASLMYLTLSQSPCLKEEVLLCMVDISGMFQGYKGSIELENGNALLFSQIPHYLLIA